MDRREFAEKKKKELMAAIENLDAEIEKLEDPTAKAKFETARKELENQIKRAQEGLDTMAKPARKLSRLDQKELQYQNSIRKRRAKNKIAKKSRKKNR